jgi:outer membrane biosynthesis protein TonB
VAKSDNPIFNDAAVEAVMQFEFSPAIQQDKPVACKVIVPVRFTLR